jgi:hypothetical protein
MNKVFLCWCGQRGSNSPGTLSLNKQRPTRSLIWLGCRFRGARTVSFGGWCPWRGIHCANGFLLRQLPLFADLGFRGNLERYFPRHSMMASKMAVSLAHY